MLLNRRAGGWNITLVNNLGVKKYCGTNCPAGEPCGTAKHCTPDIIDPSQKQSLTVTLKAEYVVIDSPRAICEH